MQRRAATPLAWAFFGSGVVFTTLTMLLAALNGRPQTPALVVAQIFGILLFATGPVVVSRQPSNPIGWIISLCFALITFGGADNFADEYGRYALFTKPGSLPAVEVVLSARNIAQGLGFFPLVTFMLLLFPTGRLPSPRWRPVAAIAAIAIAASVILRLLAPGRLALRFPGAANPFGVATLGPAIDLLSGPLTAVVFLSVAVSVLSVFLRFRDARGVERQQLKWFAYGAAFLPMSFVTGALIVLIDVPNKQTILTLLYPFSIVPLGVGIGVAMLRYRLYDIDVLINRTLVYGATTATLVAMYALAVVIAQLLLRPFTQGSEFAVAASTLATAALIQPVRRRIQSTVDRRFYRARYDAERTLDALAAHLRDEVDLGALRRELIRAVRDTMQPAHASLWLRERL